MFCHSVISGILLILLIYYPFMDPSMVRKTPVISETGCYTVSHDGVAKQWFSGKTVVISGYFRVILASFDHWNSCTLTPVGPLLVSIVLNVKVQQNYRLSSMGPSHSGPGNTRNYPYLSIVQQGSPQCLFGKYG